MFKEKDITPDFERKLLDEHVVVIRNPHEILAKTRVLPTWETASFAASRLNRIVQVWKGMQASWTLLDNMNVLDLASGSGASDDLFGNIWYPQFARLCAFNGANVIAIDFNPQTGFDRELFESANIDLVESIILNRLGNLPILRGKKFDLINSGNFIGINPCPSLVEDLSFCGTKWNVFEKMFTEQAGQLLSEGGIMVLDTKDDNHNRLAFTRNQGRLTVLDVDF